MVALAQIVLGLTILLLPWFFGGVQPRHQLWLTAALLFSLIGYLMAQARGRLVDRPLPWALVPLLAAVSLGLFQLWPQPASLLSLLSPQGNRVWDEFVPAAEVGSWGPAVERPTRTEPTQNEPSAEAKFAHSLGVSPAPAHRTISLNPASTRYDISLLVLGVGVFFVGTRLFVEDRVLLIVLVLISINGAALSLFGLIQQLRWNGLLFGTIPLTEGGVPFASFVNRNNAAGYLNMCLAASLGLTVWAFAAAGARGQRSYATSAGQRVRQFISDLNAAKLCCLALVMLTVGGLICAMSRGAWVAATGAALVTVLAVCYTRRTGFAALLLVAILAGGFGLVEWIGQTKAVQQRFETLLWQAEYPDGRLSHWQDSLATASDFLLTGSGLGTYRYIYKMYEQHAAPLWYYHAENQYLEALVDAGLPGFLLMISMLALVAAAAWKLLQVAPQRSAADRHRMSGTLPAPGAAGTPPLLATQSNMQSNLLSPTPTGTPQRSGRVAATEFQRTSLTMSFPLGVCGLFALSSQAINAAFDFGLYLPANMTLLALISGMVVAYAARLSKSQDQAMSKASRSRPSTIPRGPRPSRSRTSSRWAPVIAALLSCAVVLSGLEIQSVSRAEAALARGNLVEDPAEMTLGSVERRIALLAAASAIRPDDAELHQRAAQLWIQRFRLEALEILKQRHPQGTDLDKLWNLTSMVSLHGKVHQLRRQNQTFYLDELRRAGDVQANLPQAVRHLLLARRGCPLLVRVHLMLAETGPAVSARGFETQDLTRARRLAVGSYRFLLECGYLQSQAGRPVQACSAWRRAIEIYPDRVGQILAAAASLLDLDQYIFQLLPESPALLAEVIRQQFVDESQPSLRSRILERARQLAENTANGGDAESIQLLGAILALSGDRAGAIVQYEQAIQLAPRETTWRYQLALLLQSAGRLKDARKQAAICVRLQPHNYQYQALQKNLVEQIVAREL